RMAEVPVTLSPTGEGRISHLHPWRDGWRHLRFLLLYSPRWLYLYPGIAMIIFGVAVSALLLPGPINIGGVAIDVHTLLIAAMAILVGVQSITFGFLVRVYAIKNGILPQKERYEKLFANLTLEKMLMLGGGLILIGMAGVAWAAQIWSAKNFG